MSGQPAASTTVTCAVDETASANSGFTTESTSVGVTTVAPDVIVDPSTYATATTADFTVAVSLPVDPAPGAGDVKVTCTTSDLGVVGVAGGAVSSSLTFSAGSLGPTQLALNGEAGATADGTATVTCTVAVPGTSASTGYSAAQSDAVAVSLVVPRIVTDAEVSGALGPRPHLVMPLTADAGAIANNVVQVHLSAKPVVGQTVVVTVASQSTDDVTVSPGTITFTDGNYAAHQAVTAGIFLQEPQGRKEWVGGRNALHNIIMVFIASFNCLEF